VVRKTEESIGFGCPPCGIPQHLPLLLKTQKMKMGKIKKLFLISVIALMVASAQAATEYDLSYKGSVKTVNGAIFRQWNEPKPMGSGTIDAFLGIQGKITGGPQQGYNTDGALEFDTVSGGHTHALLLSDIPIVTLGGINYREFLLDINQSQSHHILSLDEVVFYRAAAGALSGYSPDPVTRNSTNPAFGKPIYDLDAGGDNYVKLDDQWGAGSGKGDMLLFVPDSAFTGTGNYIYLFSMCGYTMDGSDGFEEWAIGAGGSIVPEPATMCLLGLGALGLLKKRRA
jgi:hypothetical protein